MRLEFAAAAPTAAGYGPHVRVLRHGRVVYNSGPLFDVDFFDPLFFRGNTRVLMLADFGSEDSWGVFALSFEGDSVRDLGKLDVSAPEDESGFTTSALRRAKVHEENGTWLIEFESPLLLDPRGENERPLPPGAVFREVDGRFVLSAPPP